MYDIYFRNLKYDTKYKTHLIIQHQKNTRIYNCKYQAVDTSRLHEHSKLQHIVFILDTGDLVFGDFFYLFCS